MWQRRWFRYLLGQFLFLVLVLASQSEKLAIASEARARLVEPFGKIEPKVLEQLRSQGKTTFWVLMSKQADTRFAENISDWQARGQVVFDTLVESAARTQKPILDLLTTAGAEAESFWIVNTIKVTTSGEQLIKGLAARPEVASIRADASWQIPEPLPGSEAFGVQAVEWGVARVRAPEVWQQFNIRGEGIVVANIDTGVQFDHPALAMQYRGRRPDGTFDHNYNWHDPSHVCNPSLAPCDNNGHGTHTMGIIVGDDRGSNRIGVAPHAQWIAAKGCESSACSYSALLSSGQWVLAPTDLQGQNPRPDLRPHVVNNSWSSETTDDPFYRTIVQNWRNAGIFPVFASGNERSGTASCGSIEVPAAYPESFAVGAADGKDNITGSSKLGPATAFGHAVKPNVSAPGVEVRSSLPNDRYGFNSGTSAATPHVAGVVALVWSSNPGLVGNVSRTFDILQTTARVRPSTRCNPSGSPNNAYGWGIVDALAAVQKVRPGKLSFIDRTDFAAGAYPSSITVGDFNGDSIQDLVVANENASGTVSILLGKGDGTFASPRAFGVGRGPTSVAVGDFNGDKILDLAVANGGVHHIRGTTVSVLLGKGDGTFGPAQNFEVGTSPRFVAVGDFNGDAIPDLAVVNGGSNTVSILLGKGNGTFGPAQNLPVGEYPASVAIGDLNGDKIQDLAVSNGSILLGNGDGTFRRAQNFDVIGSAITIADFNGDKIPDLAVAGGRGNVSILLGKGDGTFGPAQSFGVGYSAFSVTSADFNGDKIPDLAVSTWGSNALILLGNGDGTFRSTANFGVGRWPVSITIGDFNGDKIQDLAVANHDSHSTSILIGRGDGTFRSSHNLVVGIGPISVTVGDLNGDKIQDLAVANRGFSDPPNLGTVSVLLGNPNGTFQPARNFEVGFLPTSVTLADFNGDKVLDLAVTNSGTHGDPSATVSILLGNGDGTFHSAQDVGVGEHPNSVTVGDFNGDDLPDLAVASGHDLYSPGTVFILLGNGDGTFGSAQSFSVGILPQSIAVGDFDGDKIPDLVTANFGSDNVSILLGNGDGTFRSAQSIAVGDRPWSVAVADFNGDKIQDLAVANDHSHNVSILLGNGDGTFQAAQNFAVGSQPDIVRQPRSVMVGDFNGDRILDLVTANLGSNEVSILLGNGDGTFGPAQNFWAGSGPVSVAIADFNGDDLQDLAVANSNSWNVSILINESR